MPAFALGKCLCKFLSHQLDWPTAYCYDRLIGYDMVVHLFSSWVGDDISLETLHESCLFLSSTIKDVRMP